ncbi:unnamed protein product [Owenia fusiformis]|uniref:Golgin subfamily A conserved domain-containing protein n=1 Tax=Owenia fusiformis TaxID=6347 RepID=A0A8S4NXJ2_OWEFU|nr:unnamed protein product [Owenia fusiformis]
MSSEESGSSNSSLEWIFLPTESLEENDEKPNDVVSDNDDDNIVMNKDNDNEINNDDNDINDDYNDIELHNEEDDIAIQVEENGIVVQTKEETTDMDVDHVLGDEGENMEIKRLKDEIEELSGRLKASRQRVVELERDVSTASTSSHSYEETSREFSKEVDRLKLEVYQLNKSTEEVKQQNSELQEKLHAKSSECNGLNQSVTELQSRLELSDVQIQQLSNQSGANLDSSSVEQLQQLQSNNAELQAKIDEYKNSFQQLVTERDQLAEQYQQVIHQLNDQSQHLTSQVQQMSVEREQLISRQTELEGHIKDLQAAAESNANDTSQSEAFNAQIEALNARLAEIQQENELTMERYKNQVQDNAQLSRFVEEKEARIDELESTLSRVGEQSIDHDLLLESMQGDKAALSRALTQNKELKVQFAELQNGFVKMSNENMDLTTRLQSEDHVSKELAARLGQQEDELKELREKLEMKERELQDIEANSHTLNKQLYQQDQIADRMRHYEAQSQLVETLQRELNSAQENINTLTNQNTELRKHAINAAEEKDADDTDGAKNADMVDALSASVRQLEMERNQLIEQYQEAKQQQQELKLLNEEMEKSSKMPATLNGEVVNKLQYETIRTAMEQLQEKYTKSMREKAELSDRNDQLEHLTMQLQGETDTIGEYITLYHHQRSVLYTRQKEKEEYIANMARDREGMQEKLGQLQALVMQLLQERNMLHSYTQQQGNHSNNSAIPNHVPTQADIEASMQQSNKPFGANLNNPQIDDWPDYTSSSSGDSDASEVEAIIGGSAPDADTPPPSKNKHSHHHHHHHDNHQPDTPQQGTMSEHSEQWNSPQPDNHTAQKIMHLLNEIGNVNQVDRTDFDERNFMPCKCCQGRLQIV